MTTYPLPTLGCTISETGISAPPYADILESLKVSFRGIYGSDAYLEADSQDGQWLAILARGFNDSNSGVIAAYNSFRPGSAQGAGLSSVVKINGLKRQVPTNSTADLKVVGQAGTVITDGKAGDDLGNKWALPPSVTIPPAGEIVVTSTCIQAGAVGATPNSITKILTPTLGWQTVTNEASAAAGSPVERDATLRRRQSNSTALTSITPLAAVESAVATLAGVTRVKPYENDTDTVDDNGLPRHSIAFVVEGGDAQAIAEQIALKKAPGATTFGSTAQTVIGPQGLPAIIRFSRPTIVTLEVEVTIHPLAGYTSTIGDRLSQAVVDYGNALGIGDDVITTRLYLPAQLNGAADSSTYELTLLRICKTGGALGTADVAIAFAELASFDISDVTLVVV